MVDLSKVFRRPVWEFSRFEKFVQVAFELAWLAARWADGMEKAEKVGKMLVFLDFRGDVWHFSRFDGFVEVAFDLRSAAWLAARWADGIEEAEKVGKMLVF